MILKSKAPKIDSKFTCRTIFALMAFADITLQND